MRTIHLCKFESLHGKEPEPVTIIIDDELPNFDELKSKHPNLEFKTSEQYYQDQADLLIDALHNALPQGTFDRLGIEFMKKKVSLYAGKTDG